jgi:hypothetical protein
MTDREKQNELMLILEKEIIDRSLVLNEEIKNIAINSFREALSVIEKNKKNGELSDFAIECCAIETIQIINEAEKKRNELVKQRNTFADFFRALYGKETLPEIFC